VPGFDRKLQLPLYIRRDAPAFSAYSMLLSISLFSGIPGVLRGIEYMQEPKGHAYITFEPPSTNAGLKLASVLSNIMHRGYGALPSQAARSP
jgi:hypothetical protein